MRCSSRGCGSAGLRRPCRGRRDSEGSLPAPPGLVAVTVPGLRPGDPAAGGSESPTPVGRAIFVPRHGLASRARRKSPSVCSALKLEELWTKKMHCKKGLDLRFPAVQISPRCLAERGEEPVRWMC